MGKCALAVLATSAWPTRKRALAVLATSAWPMGKRLGAVLAAIAALLTLTGCRPVINGSPQIRWWLFSQYGVGHICPRLVNQGAPLRLGGNPHVVGRFFPNRCEVRLDDTRRTVAVSFGGTGYAWLPLTGRVGFSVDAAVEYQMDFRLTDDAIYVWGKGGRVLTPPRFLVGSVENQAVDWARRTPAGVIGDAYGRQIVAGELTRGFTVIRTARGDDFALGILEPPARPTHPFQVVPGTGLVLANEDVELRPEQVDFLGPFEIARPGQALRFRHRLAGAPLDVLVVSKQVGDVWREGIQVGQPVTAPQGGVVRRTELLSPGGDQLITAPPGRYYIAVDNGSAIGPHRPNVLTAVVPTPTVLGVLVELVTY